MFSHIMVGANDVEVSKKFYDAALGALGVSPGTADEKGRVFYITQTGVFAITKPINDRPASSANGGTVGFAASSPEQVEAWHAAGIVAGGHDLRGSAWRPRDGRRRQPLSRVPARSCRQQALCATPHSGLAKEKAGASSRRSQFLRRRWSNLALHSGRRGIHSVRFVEHPLGSLSPLLPNGLISYSNDRTLDPLPSHLHHPHP